MLDEKQVQEADAAVTRAVTAFVSEFESMWGRWENVAPAYVIESALLELCTELSVLAPEIKTVAGPATVKLTRCAGRLPGLGVDVRRRRVPG
jgi:hypothetical protein